MLVNDPVINANIANMHKRPFLYKIQFLAPRLSGYKNTVWITAGTKSPKNNLKKKII